MTASSAHANQDRSMCAGRPVGVPLCSRLSTLMPAQRLKQASSNIRSLQQCTAHQPWHSTSTVQGAQVVAPDTHVAPRHTGPVDSPVVVGLVLGNGYCKAWSAVACHHALLLIALCNGSRHCWRGRCVVDARNGVEVTVGGFNAATHSRPMAKRIVARVGGRGTARMAGHFSTGGNNQLPQGFSVCAENACANGLFPSRPHCNTCPHVHRISALSYSL